MTWLDIHNPVFQSVVLPLPLACLLVGAIFLLAGKGCGARFAVVGTGVTIVLVYWLIFSWPDFPPRAASQKLGYLMLGALILSCFLAGLSNRSGTKRAIVLIASLGGLLWIAESTLKQSNFLIVLFLLAIATTVLFVLFRASDRHVEVGTAVLVSAFTLAGVAVLSSSASISQMALAVGAATGGFLLWNWPKPRLDFGDIGLLIVVSPLIWLGGQAALYSAANG